MHWPSFTIHKCKQRITKITQYLIKMTHAQLVSDRPKLVGTKKKIDRREAVRERKALAAARLERSIEKELLERLESKAYGEGLREDEGIGTEVDDETGEESETEQNEYYEREYVSDFSESEGLSDVADAVVSVIALFELSSVT
jgi:protein MAK16